MISFFAKVLIEGNMLGFKLGRAVMKIKLGVFYWEVLVISRTSLQSRAM